MSENLLSPGHTACSGCGEALGMKLILNAAGPNVIVANATGCSEIFTSRYPESAWGVPWVHSLFENTAAVASGIEAALKALGRENEAQVIAQGGDGGMADIGFGALSGMFERGHNVLTITLDNEAYMNCLSTSSMIMTKDGLKRILDIKVGDEVAAFEQKTHNLAYKRCTGIFDNGIKDVYELKTRYHSIKATANHPFLVLKRNGRGGKNNFIWRTLEEIRPADEVVTLKMIPEEKSYEFVFKKAEKGDYKVNKINPIEIPKKSSPEIMKYLGIYVGDGWTREEKAEVGFALPEDSIERREFLNLHSRLFKSKLSFGKIYIYIPSVNLARFISSLGFKKGAKNKTIPDWLFTIPLKERESFIDGLMLPDGYKFNGSWRYVSSSSELLKRLKSLAQITGFRVGKIHWQRVEKGRKCVKRELLRDTGFGYICMSKRKQPDVNKWPSQTRYRNFLADTKHFDTEKVIEIRYIGKEPTLDLRVEGEHNFIADGIVVHNTGIQRSGLTPFDARTTTSPPGELSWGNITPKKDMPQIAVAHGVGYVATATVAYFKDLEKKIKKALTIKGPKYIQVLVPCPLGWQYDPSLTIRVSKLAVETCIFPLFEIEKGKLTNVVKISAKKPVEEYLNLQGRYKHLFAKEEGKEEIAKIQAIADENARRYGLVE